MPRVALLVAGGTGGHLFPALALRAALARRGWSAHVATDRRVGEMIEGLPAAETHNLMSATPAGGSAAMARSIPTLLRGVWQARKLVKRLQPRIAVGFGGYPTVPPLVAARLSGVPIVVHEQNAVVGRANRLLIKLGAALATGLEKADGSAGARQVAHVGNPVRDGVSNAARPFRAPTPEEPFRLFVFGGSQGAHAFSELVPGALGDLPQSKRLRLRISQQARPEDLPATRDAYAAMQVEAEVAAFFTDMGERLADAHLVICRAGASTVAELAVAGRPAILVPYPFAMDDHQAANARLFAEAGGGWLMPESELRVKSLARRIAALMDWPEQLGEAAAGAAAQGRLDAAERLADFVERLAQSSA